MIAGLGAAAVLVATFIAIQEPRQRRLLSARDIIAGLLLVIGLSAIGVNLAVLLT